MKNIIYLFIIIIILSCEYNNPLNELENRDLISKLDITTWDKETGILIDTTYDVLPPAESIGYYLYFKNIIEKYDTFENSTLSSDIGNWKISEKKPTICEVISNSNFMSGNKYLHLKVQKNPEPEYIYYEFTPLANMNYIFKFDYFNNAGEAIQLSFSKYELSSDLTLDSQKITIPSFTGERSRSLFDITCFQSVRSIVSIGLRNPFDSTAVVFDLMIDNIALFEKSNHNLSKKLCIVGSKNQFNDGTGEKFNEGVYSLKIKAKAGTNNKMTIRLGSNYKEYNLSNHWEEYKIEDLIMDEQDYFIIEIMPTVINENDRFPGGIYISKPKLYYLPHKSKPDK